MATGSNPFRPASINPPNSLKITLGGRIPIAAPSKKHFEILGHELVPEHIILSEKESKEFLEKYGIKIDQLPKILSSDPAVVSIGGKHGQIVKIIRKSQTAKYATAYRLIVESE